MRALEEIRNTPVLLLTEAEISQLDPESQTWARNAQAIHARVTACQKHEPEATGTREQSLRGWHPMHCKHCGADMSVDSGD
jgi:hypothetical protein